MAFDAKSYGILNLFRDTEIDKYKIPKYQRAYSWTKEEVTTFCEDLNYVYKTNLEEYFFGAVIMIKNDKKTRDIIDGQQRMTTFTILMAKLRNLCDHILTELEMNKNNQIKYKTKIKEIREKISDLSQSLEYKGDDGNEYYKLELSETDRNFFNEYLKISRENEILDMLKILIENIEEENELKTDENELVKYEKYIEETKDLNKNIYNIILKKTKDILLKELLRKPLLGLKESEKTEIIGKIILAYMDKLESKEKMDLYKEIKKYEISKDDFEKIVLFRNFKNKKHGRNDKIPVSHKNIIEAGNTIENEIINEILDKQDIDERVNRLIDIINAFMKKMYVVAIIAENEESAYTMFQVLNDRGRSLGIIDLLRPYTLQILENKNISKAYFEEVSLSWDRLAEKDNCDEYMRIYLESYIKVSRKDKKIHNKYKEIFFGEDIAPVKVRDRIKDIEKKYEIYEKILDGEWPYNSSKVDRWTKNRLKEIIKKLKYKGSIPLLMAIYDECDEDDFVYVVDIIERTVFRYRTVCGRKADKLLSIYDRSIAKIRECRYIDREEFKNDMSNLFIESECDMKEFRDKIKEKGKLNYDNIDKGKLLYFLTTIESYYRPDYLKYKVLIEPNKAVINDGNIWIEHIYPQKPEDTDRDKKMDKVVNNLGNLTILEDKNNRKLSNKPFKEKKEGYKIEKLIITNILYEYQKWGKKEIEERENMYIDIAERIFTLD